MGKREECYRKVLKKNLNGRVGEMLAFINTFDFVPLTVMF